MAKDDTSPATSQVLSVRGPQDAAALAELKEILRGGEFSVEVNDDPAEISKQMMAEILDAENVDELEGQEAQGWAEFLGVPMEIRGFKFRPSTVEGATGIYLVVYAVNMEDGESLILTCGALSVIGKLVKLAEFGEIPGAVRILTRSEEKTKSGFYPLNLSMTPAEIEARRAARVAARKGETAAA
jgi:hypothetical protein